MAVEDEQIGRLRTMIEIAERKGEGKEPRTQRLRDELAEALRGEGRYEDESDDDVASMPEVLLDSPSSSLPAADPSILETLPLADRIKRRVQDYGCFKLADFAKWTPRLLRLAIGPRDAHIVREAMARLGLTDLLASADDVLFGLPAKTPFAVDARDGRKLEDLDRIFEGLADGDFTQRTGSTEAGGKEHAGWHQRICSLLDRGSERAVPFFERAMRRDHGDAAWFVDVEIVRIPQAERREWGLKLVSRWTESDTLADIDRRDRLKHQKSRLAPLNDGKGRGEAKRSWGGISLLFCCAE